MILRLLLFFSARPICLIGLLGVFFLGATPGKKPMNVLFIVVDDLRPELGCYGQRHIHSPNIDQLAGEGFLFERAYCQQALCTPSRTSLLTGLRPEENGVWDLMTHFRTKVPAVVTLPQYFKSKGYNTIGVGKIFHFDDDASWSEPNWHPAKVSKRGYVLESNNRLAARNKFGNGMAYEAASVPDNAYPDGMTADRAIQVLQGQAGKPFFLAVGFSKPHLPFAAPQKYWDLYPEASVKPAPHRQAPHGAPAMALNRAGELSTYAGLPRYDSLSESETQTLRRGYFACVSYADAQVGRVLGELKRLGLDKNTIVVLWGDHGYKIGDYNDWCKHTNFEIDTRAPLLVRTPRMDHAGSRTKALVEFVDVYPSVCELAGLPLPAHLQGKSFAPLLKKPARAWKTAAYSQYLRDPGTIMGYSVRTDRYRFTAWYPTARPDSLLATELYDHQADPDEMNNVAALPRYGPVVANQQQVLKKGFRVLNYTESKR